MSAPAEAPEPEEFTVFEGSSPADVSHARQLWRSLYLLPPPESRLLSADIHQRLPVSRPQRGSPASDPPGALALRQGPEERRRCVATVEKRREIRDLLRRQRERRIQKELISEAVKPTAKFSREKMRKPQEASDTEMDEDLVKKLQ